MSIGYETQVPPISTLTFYNAIANGGKMMQPRFVKEIRDNEGMTKEFPPVVLRESIAKETTIKKITTILEQVVRLGLGKKAGSTSFLVAGKRGRIRRTRADSSSVRSYIRLHTEVGSAGIWRRHERRGVPRNL